jgi:leader peptidase (prepilin peptidase)/N-methyltransferase
VRWYDNLPVLSYLLLRGKCRSCRAPISVRYPVIELCVAFLFIATWLKFGPGAWLPLRDWPWVSLVVAITFIDLEHRIIPDRLSLPGLALGLLTAWLDPTLGPLNALIGAGLGFGVFFGMAWLYARATGRMGLGGGDVKYLAMIGAFVGPFGVFYTILVSSVLGSVVGIAFALASGRKRLMRVSLPYGPFLSVGALGWYLLGDFLELARSSMTAIR